MKTKMGRKDKNAVLAERETCPAAMSPSYAEKPATGVCNVTQLCRVACHRCLHLLCAPNSQLFVWPTLNPPLAWSPPCRFDPLGRLARPWSTLTSAALPGKAGLIWDTLGLPPPHLVQPSYFLLGLCVARFGSF